jgi:hypothetical protein
MGMITFVYVVLMMAGIVWVALRFRQFMQAERERESQTRWAEIRMEKDFDAYLEGLSKQKVSAVRQDGGSPVEGKPLTENGGRPFS